MLLSPSMPSLSVLVPPSKNNPAPALGLLLGDIVDLALAPVAAAARHRQVVDDFDTEKVERQPTLKMTSTRSSERYDADDNNKQRC